MLDLNIDLLLVLALIFVFLITVAFLSKYNICNNGLCKIYDEDQTYTTNFFIFFLVFICLIIIIWYYYSELVSLKT